MATFEALQKVGPDCPTQERINIRGTIRTRFWTVVLPEVAAAEVGKDGGFVGRCQHKNIVVMSIN